jgi:hypothetical protein
LLLFTAFLPALTIMILLNNVAMTILESGEDEPECPPRRPPSQMKARGAAIEPGPIPLMGGEPADRMHRRKAVTFRLVAREGDPHRVLRRGPCDDSPSQQLGIAERISNPVRGQRVLPPPGIPDQRPARCMRPQ